MRIRCISWLGKIVLVSLGLGIGCGGTSHNSYTYVEGLSTYMNRYSEKGKLDRFAEKEKVDRSVEKENRKGIILSYDENKYLKDRYVKARLKEIEERKKRETAKWARVETAKRAKAEVEKRELPADLVIADFQFQDYNSFCYHDKILNAGEKANIAFVLKNEGKGIGFCD